MNTAITAEKASAIIEAVIAKGDIAQLTPDERAKYYVRVCESIGLNPMTRPFEYIVLNGRLVLYARKDCTDQLRSIYGVSITDLSERERDGVFTIVAKVVDKHGRTDMATGAVNIKALQGEALANAMMKAETKSKRRATLSICGLGFLDESELPATSPAPLSPEGRPRLADQLDALSPPHSGNAPAEKQKRGRPQTPYVPSKEDITEAQRIQDKRDRLKADLDRDPIEQDLPEPEPVMDDDWPGPEVSDYAYGKADAAAGRMGCLNRDIQNDPARMAEWQRGYDSVKRRK